MQSQQVGRLRDREMPQEKPEFPKGWFSTSRKLTSKWAPSQLAFLFVTSFGLATLGRGIFPLKPKANIKSRVAICSKLLGHILAVSCPAWQISSQIRSGWKCPPMNINVSKIANWDCRSSPHFQWEWPFLSLTLSSWILAAENFEEKWICRRRRLTKIGRFATL